MDCGGGERVGADRPGGWPGSAIHHGVWLPACNHIPGVFSRAFWRCETFGTVGFSMSYWSTRQVELSFIVLHTRPSVLEAWCLLRMWFLWSGVIAGSVIAVLLLGVLICFAVFVYYRRPGIIRLVLPLWLTWPPEICSKSLFFTTAGKSSSVVATCSGVKSQSKSIPVSCETSDITCSASWTLAFLFQGHFCCKVLWPLPQTQ